MQASLVVTRRAPDESGSVVGTPCLCLPAMQARNIL